MLFRRFNSSFPKPFQPFFYPFFSTTTTTPTPPQPTSSSPPPPPQPRKPSGTLKTTTDVKEMKQIVPILSALAEIRSRSLDGMEIAFREEATPGSPSSCFIRLVYPLSYNVQLRKHYEMFSNTIRVGRLLEDMDALAGDVSYRLNGGSKKEMTIVTACIDHVDFAKLIPLDKDLILQGAVSWTGTSSLEVEIELLSGIWKNTDHTGIPHLHEAKEAFEGKDDLTYIGSAHFTMVLRDLANHKSTPTQALVPETELEKRKQQGGADRKIRRTKLTTRSLELLPPDLEESTILHSLFLTRKKHSDHTDPKVVAEWTKNFVDIRDTHKQATLIMYPQDRNLHNRAFGGHLVRIAMELAWSCAYNFSGKFPQILDIDDIQFLKAVHVGSICTFDSAVIYSEPATGNLLVCVDCFVLNVVGKGLEKAERTGRFHFAFKCDDGKSKIKEVMPLTYGEGLEYLKGRRILTHWTPQ